ncbi:hypothetical protein BCR37DRAFT_316238 [Protomyces lactucae-debilis]|uniref:Uncharacterized protein n=1 Tax=Protomyces lactucae-debilis TaxID=2754530 RepID=A0A1Y2FF52_PROLT|nr:uncharacterized protein BCR37DRAFT_316238 [Protomyces lactucae-debilis]ORY82590.1 hypothetical protein BCR37DRAFT_316238 [Protomyces lactucae-debilis]
MRVKFPAVNIVLQLVLCCVHLQSVAANESQLRHTGITRWILHIKRMLGIGLEPLPGTLKKSQKKPKYPRDPVRWCNQPMISLNQYHPKRDNDTDCKASCHEMVAIHANTLESMPFLCQDLSVSKEYDWVYYDTTRYEIPQPGYSSNGQGYAWMNCWCDVKLVMNRMRIPDYEFNEDGSPFTPDQEPTFKGCTLDHLARSLEFSRLTAMTSGPPTWLREKVLCSTRDPIDPEMSQHWPVLKVILYGQQLIDDVMAEELRLKRQDNYDFMASFPTPWI